MLLIPDRLTEYVQSDNYSGGRDTVGVGDGTSVGGIGSRSHGKQTRLCVNRILDITAFSHSSAGRVGPGDDHSSGNPAYGTGQYGFLARFDLLVGYRDI